MQNEKVICDNNIGLGMMDNYGNKFDCGWLAAHTNFVRHNVYEYWVR